MFVTEEDGLKTLERSATSLTELHCMWSQEDFFRHVVGPWAQTFLYVNCKTSVKRLRLSRGIVLAFCTRVRGFTPGVSRRIFRAKISSARLPSEGK
jgi:hypothetical protein